MKNVTLWGTLILVVVLAVAIGFALRFGESSEVFATGSISIAPELESPAQSMRTLFITVFDANSLAPMPYGAMQAHIRRDAKGKFYDFVITKDNLMIMNPNLPAPQKLRIKARLDVDGMGGMDQDGDLVGSSEAVDTGSRDLALVINTKVAK